MFKRTFIAGWGKMDFNQHMANTAYLDSCPDTRLAFFAENGFPASEFKRQAIGPVVLKDEISYFAEIGLLEHYDVTLSLAGCREDGSRFIFRNEFFKASGKLSARINSLIGWMDLSARKLVAPPDDLREALFVLDRTEDFQSLPPSAR